MANKRFYDQLGRPLRDLRISVTDRCNFRCSYCMPSEIFDKDFMFLPRNEVLSFEEITKLATLFVEGAGIEKIRITGGEPLVRKDLVKLIRMLSKIEGIKDIAMTTNGALLKKHALELKDAGLQRVTISLDSLNDERFRKINGRNVGVDQILEGIEAAKNVGLQVKINMVVQRGLNHEDIVPMVRYFKDTDIILRFIEFMDVGNSNGWKLDQVVSKKEIFDRINKEFPIEPIKPNYEGEVATRFGFKDNDNEIGIISSVTDAFCSNCQRARLSADGKLVTCLFASEGHDLRDLLRSGASDDQLLERIASIWTARTDRYSEERLLHTDKKQIRKIEMSHIGG
ncbi:cyclic pyranopterin phosphate synthase [Anaerobacillus alkalidiazotrophicus]|uniref:GTP 3',8-cyclase n=1 Tax=Anaerobacillus alkalidiazotrophicus TaxID=472963 RepID=A0A1S2M8U1_9BACI|nr:GTP 3',8-cyclase MoaA [Anaerobacillus alkalidiazotrophicus]OIJ20085.1 cyclic pyranopterin phosphate synthase [Anaerobacillus alkalidiazotrophicus]